MEHTLKEIATIFSLDEEKLTEFALLPIKRHKDGILNEHGVITTTTFFSDSLINDFKKETQWK